MKAKAKQDPVTILNNANTALFNFLNAHTSTITKTDLALEPTFQSIDPNYTQLLKYQLTTQAQITNFQTLLTNVINAQKNVPVPTLVDNIRK